MPYLKEEQYNLKIEDILNELPTTDPNNQYWLVRADAGNYYRDFFSNNYIAIGWNEISTETIDNLSYDSNLIRSKLISINKLQNNQKNRRAMGSAAKQMIRFQHDIKKGNIVLVPSENSSSFAVGIVTSNIYTEVNEELLDLTHCPFIKRKKIKWLGEYDRDQFDPSLHKIVYAAHAISDISNYKGVINRVVYDTYVESDLMHMTFNIKHQNGISLESLTNLLSSYSKICRELYPDEKIVVKINLQSPGPIEIIGLSMVVASVSTFVFYNFGSPATLLSPIIKAGKYLKHGGKFGLSKDGISAELPNVKQTEFDEQRLEMEKDTHSEDIIDRKVDRKIKLDAHQLSMLKDKISLLSTLETDDNKEDINSAKNKFLYELTNLDSQPPEELMKAINKVSKEDEDSED